MSYRWRGESRPYSGMGWDGDGGKCQEWMERWRDGVGYVRRGDGTLESQQSSTFPAADAGYYESSFLRQYWYYWTEITLMQPSSNLGFPVCLFKTETEKKRSANILAGRKTSGSIWMWWVFFNTSLASFYTVVHVVKCYYNMDTGSLHVLHERDLSNTEDIRLYCHLYWTDHGQQERCILSWRYLFWNLWAEIYYVFRSSVDTIVQQIPPDWLLMSTKRFWK